MPLRLDYDLDAGVSSNAHSRRASHVGMHVGLLGSAVSQPPWTIKHGTFRFENGNSPRALDIGGHLGNRAIEQNDPTTLARGVEMRYS